MNAVEFMTELSGSNVLAIPSDVAEQLPKSGKARIIVLTGADTEDAEWRAAAYEQFLRDDPPEDAVYESLR